MIAAIPAWPCEQSVDFKLHGPGNTTVEIISYRAAAVAAPSTDGACDAASTAAGAAGAGNVAGATGTTSRGGGMGASGSNGEAEAGAP